VGTAGQNTAFVAVEQLIEADHDVTVVPYDENPVTKCVRYRHFSGGHSGMVDPQGILDKVFLDSHNSFRDRNRLGHYLYMRIELRCVEHGGR
jgi:hypothetical protein